MISGLAPDAQSVRTMTSGVPKRLLKATSSCLSEGLASEDEDAVGGEGVIEGTDLLVVKGRPDLESGVFKGEVGG